MRHQEPLPALGFTFSPLSRDDLEFLNEVRNSASQYLHDQRKFSMDETRQWFEQRQQTGFWLIRLDKQPVGYFRTKLIGPQAWEIGADLHESFRGQGFAKVMYRSFAQNILAPHGVSTCSLRVLKSNPRAIHVYKSLGFAVTVETETDLGMEITVENLSSGRSPQNI